MKNKRKLFWNIFDKKRLALLPKLKFLKAKGFYLAGGTALALQIRHRISVDFDFYIRGKFDTAQIYEKFQQQKPTRLLLDAMSENTLLLEIENIGISLFTYNYPMLKPMLASEYLNIASLEDIAAMKLIAIMQRGVKRDFIDLYFLSRLLGLEKIMDLAKKKYPGFNRYLAFQALVYFTDAESKQKRETRMLEPLGWKGVKRYLEAEVMRLKRQWSHGEK